MAVPDPKRTFENPSGGVVGPAVLGQRIMAGLANWAIQA
jgi:hypothetical protein